MTNDRFASLLASLKEKGLSLGSVESLTGGLFGSTLCSIPGASAAYKGGIITYVASLKTRLAGVDEKLISEYGVVSKEVAEAMAKGGLKALGSDIAISCTGNAGPTEEPGGAGVGTVYIGLATPSGAQTYERHFEGDRNAIRQETIMSMASIILEHLEKTR